MTLFSQNDFSYVISFKTVFTGSNLKYSCTKDHEQTIRFSNESGVTMYAIMLPMELRSCKCKYLQCNAGWMFWAKKCLDLQWYKYGKKYTQCRKFPLCNTCVTKILCFMCLFTALSLSNIPIIPTGISINYFPNIHYPNKDVSS